MGTAASEIDACVALVRRDDRPRYLATLLAPAACRDDLMALYAFNCELSRIPLVVNEPMAGEIRVQWWRDALAGEGHGDVRSNPVAASLLDTIERHRLSFTDFDAVLNGCSVELDGGFLADMNALEGYLGERVSMLFKLAGLISGLAPTTPGLADASGHSGVAYGLTSVLASFAMDRKSGRCFIPEQVCHAHGLTFETIAAGDEQAKLTDALTELHDAAWRHLRLAEEYIMLLPDGHRRSFLPIALLPARLKQLKAILSDPGRPVADRSQLGLQWTLLRNLRRFS
ncbi:phytoene/squalene synthase family protein [Coralliovum pocilloporae]|uniref:phytoene/squalene synthase family protein n=1 Tax=Coralliovum pocilloporae TaxID=3066369 RepID=UPI003307A4AB